MTQKQAQSVPRSCGAAGLYVLAAFLLAFGFAMTAEPDHPDAFPGRRDSDGAWGALICVAWAAMCSGLSVMSLSRGLVSKVVCGAIITVCLYRAIGVITYL
ncbi:hypothetical protein [Streptomyces sp. NPDC096323]|uniref:hypothetical protein n=1 Tax=Streptomyces sp. NPDC096323 TaxID=3155822 RepID=UPI003328A567